MPDLPDIAQALLNPAMYHPAPEKVDLVQTQMSFIFLAGHYVYKIKKPVNLGYLDYSTLAKRLYFSRKELELNRRLCPDTYLEEVPVTRDNGQITLNGRGEIIDYAVKMRRLPLDRMMNVLLEKDEVSPDMVTRVADKLAAFHEKARTSPEISAFGTVDAIKVNTDENFIQTESYIRRTISPAAYRFIKKYTDSFIENKTPLLQERVAAGRIRDCHGDLHAAHICFADDICIYDAIEFNDRFRYCDVASEIAFLAMDLDHYGRADLSRVFAGAYIEKSGDMEINQLLRFYKGYRAYVRGKVEGFKLNDPYIPKSDKTQISDVAASYYDLACFYARQKPLLIITVGLVGTGKTALSYALARRTGAIVISSDVVRKQLAGVPVSEHRFELFYAGLYSADFTRLTYDKMFDNAREALDDGYPVILDASFIRAQDRAKAQQIAEEHSADFFIIECRLDRDHLEQRLLKRMQEKSVSDGRLEILADQEKKFEPVTEISSGRHIVVDTSPPLPQVTQSIIDRISKIQ